MIMLTDFGCSQHRPRHLKYSGLEAKVMANVVANLPSEGDCHTYICDQGHTHRLSCKATALEILTEGQGELQSQRACAASAMAR